MWVRGDRLGQGDRSDQGRDEVAVKRSQKNRQVFPAGLWESRELFFHRRGDAIFHPIAFAFNDDRFVSVLPTPW